ncbi:MAG: tetrapyrrole methylase [Thermogutta sp.]|uniref:SAM-dependent methyltransferase n=1 Tax=Thermogutta sp. TaxID=1962930 RepID=UPI0019BD9B00|nr:SAM-dependent methyltransferase [Thermogutta sp.]MBC7351294.1 tetrapyrrole methylase [Thermogutta sp.]
MKRALMIVAWMCWIGWSWIAFAELPRSPLYLVGVGPGDPDLITLRAIEAIRHADIIYCTDGLEKKFADYLAGKQVITGYWRLFEYYGQDINSLPEAEQPRARALAEKRNDFISQVRQAVARGKVVAILDSGDPLIYGPWAWCLEEFADLKPVVVPGVSCFNAGNAALRRGVTNAPKTKSVILTANDWPGKTDTVESLSVHRATMVIFTMRAEFDYFIEKLKTHYPPETPVAIVKYAGYQGKEEVIEGTLATIREQVDPKSLPFEYLIYVGDFLTYRQKAPARVSAANPSAVGSVSAGTSVSTR